MFPLLLIKALFSFSKIVFSAGSNEDDFYGNRSLLLASNMRQICAQGTIDIDIKKTPASVPQEKSQGAQIIVSSQNIDRRNIEKPPQQLDEDLSTKEAGVPVTISKGSRNSDFQIIKSISEDYKQKGDYVGLCPEICKHETEEMIDIKSLVERKILFPRLDSLSDNLIVFIYFESKEDCETIIESLKKKIDITNIGKMLLNFIVTGNQKPMFSKMLNDHITTTCETGKHKDFLSVFHPFFQKLFTQAGPYPKLHRSLDAIWKKILFIVGLPVFIKEGKRIFLETDNYIQFFDKFWYSTAASNLLLSVKQNFVWYKNEISAIDDFIFSTLNYKKMRDVCPKIIKGSDLSQVPCRVLKLGISNCQRVNFFNELQENCSSLIKGLNYSDTQESFRSWEAYKEYLCLIAETKETCRLPYLTRMSCVFYNLFDGWYCLKRDEFLLATIELDSLNEKKPQ